LIDNDKIKEEYFDQIIDRMEILTRQKLKKNVIFKKSYCVSDFLKDYNAYQGNAYGLANTLRQTAFLKPKIENKKVHNLFYTGQLTVPGPGVPPAIISGKICAGLAIKKLKA
jgi:phytoene desaturase